MGNDYGQRLHLRSPCIKNIANWESGTEMMNAMLAKMYRKVGCEIVDENDEEYIMVNHL